MSGEYTDICPISPHYCIEIGIVLNEHKTQGIILIRPDHPKRLNNNADSNSSGLINNDMMVYDTSVGYWRNKRDLNINSLVVGISGSNCTISSSGLIKLKTPAVNPADNSRSKE